MTKTTRREFLTTASAAMIMAGSIDPLSAAAAKRSFGIAWTSFPVRNRQTTRNHPQRKPALPADEFIALCLSFGAAGVQMGFDQLASTDGTYLQGIRRLLDEKQMYMELGIGAKTLESAEAFARVADAAQQLGVSRLRMACLSGRRYETFADLNSWQQFAGHWKRVLKEAEPILKKHKLYVGIENHKDWHADEQVEILKNVSSPWLGACVDFGNNIALLEDPLETARKLAPYAVTSHLKDMALKPSDDGFELSEVALGTGSTPLGQIIDILRRARADIHFCLEMITRDPLSVPYKTDRYWATYEKRDAARIRSFEREVLARTATDKLPRLTGKSDADALAFENENIRSSADYAAQTLKI